MTTPPQHINEWADAVTIHSHSGISQEIIDATKYQIQVHYSMRLILEVHII